MIGAATVDLDQCVTVAVATMVCGQSEETGCLAKHGGFWPAGSSSTMFPTKWRPVSAAALQGALTINTQHA
jgi:hypothetical protein